MGGAGQGGTGEGGCPAFWGTHLHPSGWEGRGVSPGLQGVLRGPRPCLTPSGHLSPGREEVRRWEGRKGGNREAQTKPRPAGLQAGTLAPLRSGPISAPAHPPQFGPRPPSQARAGRSPCSPERGGSPANQVARPGFGKFPELGSRRPGNGGRLLAPQRPAPQPLPRRRPFGPESGGSCPETVGPPGAGPTPSVGSRRGTSAPPPRVTLAASPAALPTRRRSRRVAMATLGHRGRRGSQNRPSSRGAARGALGPVGGAAGTSSGPGGWPGRRPGPVGGAGPPPGAGSGRGLKCAGRGGPRCVCWGLGPACPGVPAPAAAVRAFLPLSPATIPDSHLTCFPRPGGHGARPEVKELVLLPERSALGPASTSVLSLF